MSLRARVLILPVVAALACDRSAPAAELSPGTAPAPVEPAEPAEPAEPPEPPEPVGPVEPAEPPEPVGPGDLSPGTAAADAPPRPAAGTQGDLSPETAPLEPAPQPVSLPQGRWESPDEYQRVCFTMLPDGVAVLTFFDGESEGWKPVHVFGKPKASRRGDAPISVSFAVDRVERKGISSCRKFVVDQRLAQTRQLGATWKPGASVEFTLAFTADRRGVRLCVQHAEGAPTCRELRRVEV